MNILVKIGGSRRPSLMRTIYNYIKQGFAVHGNHNIELKKLSDKVNNYNKFDLIVFVFWKLKPTSLEELQIIKQSNIQTLFFSDGLFPLKHKDIDGGYKYPFLVFTGGPQSSSFCNRNYNKHLPGNRLNVFGDELKLIPWNLDGKRIVIAHQRGIDYNLNYKHKFYKDLIIGLKYKGYYTIFRVHPSCSKKSKDTIINQCGADLCDEISWSNRDSFELTDIYASISYGGKASSRYIIRGIPSFTKEDTISRPVSCDIQDIQCRVTPSREWWVRWLSYRHWTLEEFSKGLTLDFLVKYNEVVMR